MPTEAKRAKVAELAELLSGSPASIVADYRGLSVADLHTIRRSLREHGIQYTVVKNRLGRIAAEQADRSALQPLLQGPTAIALGGDDEATLAKHFLEAIRPYRSVVVRGGLIGEQPLDASGIGRLAELPNREVLLGQLAGAVASPIGTLGAAISAPIRSLGYALQQLAAQRAESQPTA